MKKIIFILIVLSASILGCENYDLNNNQKSSDIQSTLLETDKKDFIEKKDSTSDFKNIEKILGDDITYKKVADINENVALFYSDRRIIFIKSEEGYKVLSSYLTSYPELAPDKRKIAYIEPNEQDLPRTLYIYNIENDLKKFILETDEKGTNTPKVVKWLNNEYLGLIIGYGYGSVSLGGSLYVYDINNEELFLALTPEKKSEFRNLRVDGESIILDIVKWTDDNWNEYIIEQKKITYTELIEKAGIVSK